MLFIQEKN